MDNSVPSLPSNARMLRIFISNAVKDKLQNKHKVNPEWISGCFRNRRRDYMKEVREEHRTLPQTQWFIAEYEPEKQLKICFVYLEEERAIVIKTAYPPSERELEIYMKAPLIQAA